MTKNLELAVIRLFIRGREDYYRHINNIQDISFTQEVQNVLKCIGSYYEQCSTHDYIHVNELEAYFYVQYPLYKDKDVYKILFNNLAELSISDTTAETFITQLVHKDRSTKLLYSLSQSIEALKFDNTIADIESQLLDYKRAIQFQEKPDDEFYTESLEDIFAGEEPGLRLWSEELNADLGEAFSGDTLSHVYALSNVGKTSFVCNMIRCFLTQIPVRPILWIINEESKKRQKKRYSSVTLNAPVWRLKEDPKRADDMLRERGGDRVLLVHDPGCTLDKIKEYGDRLNPRVIFIDQGTKVHFRGEHNHNETDRLKHLYNGFRELGPTIGADIITVGQASGQAENKKWLSQSDMDYSRNCMQGELDLAIGISAWRNEDNTRYIHYAKNKFGEASKIELVIDPATGRFY